MLRKPLFQFFPESIEPSINRHVRWEKIQRYLLSAGFHDCSFQRIHLGQVSFDRGYARKHKDGLFNNTDAANLDIVREMRMKDLEKFASDLANYGAKATYSWERTLIVAR